MFSRLFSFLALALLLTACGLPPSDPTSAQGKRAILDDVNIYLSAGNCSAALTEILPLFNSSNSDNDVRTAIASVYACEAGFNFFDMLSSAQGISISTNGFDFFAKNFPSANSPSDKKFESAGFGIDALMSIISPGQVLVPGDLFNTSTYNEGSLLWSDRTVDSNAYLYFVSMVAMGTLENRVGATAAGKPTNNPPLPWTTSTTAASGSNGGMQTVAGYGTSGCDYASSVVNFADASASISTQCLTGSAAPPVTNALAYVVNQLNCAANAALPGESFAQLIYDACNYGCQNIQPAVGNVGLLRAGVFNALGGWVNNACGSNTGACATCPLLLRNRSNCAATASDQVSCAAAGVVNFVNNAVIGWQ